MQLLLESFPNTCPCKFGRVVELGPCLLPRAACCWLQFATYRIPSLHNLLSFLLRLVDNGGHSHKLFIHAG